MDDLVWNERTKLFASALDRVSTASVTVGVLAPVAGALYGVAPAGIGWPFQILFGVIWLFAGFILHIAARMVVGSIRQ